MKTYFPSSLLRLLAASLLVLGASACSSPPAPGNITGNASLAEQITQEIGSALCDTPQQCQTIAIGARACGGPERYLAWSSKSSDGMQLKALAQAQTEAARQQQQEGGMASICSIVTDPGATCVANRCVLQGSGPE